ncbi:MAG: FadR/GntR family transcriptional regulator [Dinoroseobacter sp.]|nr:FadR/GntR family transcriptional regulator [Dinoroseobacter sp.]MDJ0993495.1 FadR/GntR family transcriptional regulator [Dinoroseobacter sp.]
MTDNRSVFDPIDHDSVADAVVEKIEDLIVNRVLRQGAKLPAERDLAEMLSVSRPKLREALKRLEDEGLIEVVKGEGSFVAKLTNEAMSPALLDLFSRHGDAFFEYLEYRREQEAFAARLAADRHTEFDAEAIRAEVKVMEEAQATNDLKAGMQADIRFHSAIVDAAHNTMLNHMMTSIYDLTRKGVFYNREYLRAIDGTGEALLSQHKEIARAILGRDPDEAEKAARDHIDFVEASFRKGMDQARRETLSRKRRMVSDQE